MVKSKGARNAMTINGALRVISLSALPLFHLIGVMNMATLLVGAMAEGFLLSSIMTTEGSFLPALFPAKQLRNINGALFMMFPAVQVVLGLFMRIGHYADLVSPFLVFAVAAAINFFIVMPLVWFMIPNTKLVGLADPSANPTPASTPTTTALSRAAAFIKKYWKEAALLGTAVGVFAGLTWGLPALAAAGIGGKTLAEAAAYLQLHSSLTAPLPIVGALIYAITRSEPFKALRLGHAAKASDEEKALYEQRGRLAAEIADLRRGGASLSAVNAKEDELAAVQSRLSVYRGRQLKSITLMSLGTLMFYPLYLVATPAIAETLVGHADKFEMTAQFLGALFFGNMISTVARTVLPNFELPLPGGRKLPVNTTFCGEGGGGGHGGPVRGDEGIRRGHCVGLARHRRGGDGPGRGIDRPGKSHQRRGWIKLTGVGFAAVWLPFIVWTWPALIPFLTVKTAVFLSLLAAGVVNGPSFVSLISYLMGNTERSENSTVTGVQGAFFNAGISTGYALLTIASDFLSPAYPAVLAILGLANLAIGAIFWRAPKSLPGLAPAFFIPKAPKVPADPAPVKKEDVK